jgi:DNA-binding NarL/FixJ family response regulator
VTRARRASRDGQAERERASLATLDARAQHTILRQLAQPVGATPFDALTPRERDVLRLIARGASNKQIAAELFLSLGTVKGYVSVVLEKLRVADRTTAALLATRHGLEAEEES